MKGWLRLCPLYRLTRPGAGACLRGRLGMAHVWVIRAEATDEAGPWAWLCLSDAEQNDRAARLAKGAEANVEARERKR